MDGGFDAIVLAGGRAQRLGGADKPGLDVGGTSLLDHVLAAVGAAGRVVCVGPARPVTGRAPLWCREDPPGGGPVAGIAAGFEFTSAGTVLVFAADLPWIAAAVPVLLTTLDSHRSADAALLTEPDGRVNFLAGAWRRAALDDALRTNADHVGMPMRRLVDAVRAVPVFDTEGWGRDCDTWTDIERARSTAWPKR